MKRVWGDYMVPDNAVEVTPRVTLGLAKHGECIHVVGEVWFWWERRWRPWNPHPQTLTKWRCPNATMYGVLLTYDQAEHMIVKKRWRMCPNCFGFWDYVDPKNAEANRFRKYLGRNRRIDVPERRIECTTP